MFKKLFIFIISFCLFQNAMSQVGSHSLVFNGSSDYYSVLDNSTLDLNGNATIELWVNPCDTVNRVVLSKHWCASANGSYFIQILNGAVKWGWVPLGGCTGASIYITGNGIIKNNEWQHIAIVHTPTAVRIYRNGILQTGSLTNGSYSGLFKNNSVPLRVGTYQSQSGVLGPFYIGRMDEIRIWNAALTASQILSRKDSSLVGNETNLVLYHNFDTDTNINIQNKAISSGTTNNGTTTSTSPYFLSNSSSYPEPFTLGNDTNLCAPTALTFYARVSPYNYLWDNSSTLRYRTVFTSGVYSVSIYNQKCIVSDTISVTMGNLSLDLGNDTLICNDTSLLLDATSAGFTYLWNDGSTNATYNATSNGNHWVTINNGICSYSDTIHIIFDSVGLVFRSDTTICSNDSILLFPTTSATNFLWNTGSSSSNIWGSNPGIYWVEVSKGGCFLRDSMQLFVNTNSVNLGNDTLICGGNQLVLDVSNLSSSYIWNTGSTNSSITIDSSGMYSVSVITNGCPANDSINVVVQELNSVFTVSDTIGCEPLSVNFTDFSSVNFGSINNWNWTFGDGTFSSLPNPNKSYLTPGLYTIYLNVSSNFGCNDDTVMTSLIRVNPKPNANFFIGTGNWFTHDQINFTNRSTFATSYIWSFGNGDTSSLTNPSHTYSLPGSYTAELIATNLFNCSDTINYQLIVSEQSKLFVPNTFTPNDDDLNETWRIHGLTEDQDIIVFVFNRWGELIYESNSSSEGWDGKHKGLDVPIGIYSYKIRLKNFGVTKEYFGHINLIR